MDRQRMEQVAGDANQRPEVENARVVEFLGTPHVHIDFINGNIGTISKDDEYIIIPVKSKAHD